MSDVSSGRARTLLEHERSDADATLVREREEESERPRAFLAREREATDSDLVGERGYTDTLLVNQREANAQMVSATIRAQELRDEADIDRARAEKSEQELRSVAEFREMFIGILGHDLRNPLGSIGMAAALLLRRGRLGAQDAEVAARIVRAGQRMTRMISQMLDLTRARLGGGLPIEPRAMDLGEVCRNVVEEFETPIQSSIEGDLTGIWDGDRLAEVFSNLAGNAIEYSAPGSVVRLSARAERADAVIVEVTNQGEPIPADVLPFIFEPFRRARQQRKSTAGNLGLGLYIAHQIIMAHGGTIYVRSAEGETTFVIRLPRYMS